MDIVKMKDVAALAGVSVATVTRVMNGSGYASEKAKKAVEQAVIQLGYVPNKTAGILKSQNSGILGNITPTPGDNLFLLQVSGAISRYASENGYHILAMQSDNDPQNEKALLDDLFGRMAEGIILTAGVNSDPKAIQSIINRGMAVVMIERPLAVYGADKVLINSFEGSAIATEFFIAMGHKDIGFIGPNQGGRVEIDRLEGFRQTLEQRKLSITDKNCVFIESYDPELGYLAMKSIMEQRKPPTALLISSDITAYGALQYLYEQRLRVPDDISIIGYDNTYSAMTSPPLTSIAFPIEEIGKTVIRMILERKHEKRNAAKSVCLSPTLVDRGSVRVI